MILRRNCLFDAIKAGSVSAEKLAGIILKSGTDPMGRITDHFDKNVKSIFSNPLEANFVSLTVLRDGTPGKLKIPPKIKEKVVSALLESFNDLSLKDISAIPNLFKRFPASFLVSEAEDLLFERFVSTVFENLKAFSTQDLQKILEDLSTVRLRHACKNEPIIRFFESVSPTLNLLTASGLVLKREILVHPVVRARCIEFANNVSDHDLGLLLVTLSRLSVFPEVSLMHLASRNRRSESPSEGLVALLSMRRSTTDEANACFAKLEGFDINEVLSGLVGIKRVNSVVADCVFRSLRATNLNTSREIAGYLKLVSISRPESLSDELQKWLPLFKPDLSSDALAVVTVVRCMSLSERADCCEFFKQHAKPTDLSPGQMSHLCEHPFTGLEAIVYACTQAESVAVALVKLNTQAVADRLSTLMKPIKNIAQLTRISSILSDSGAIHLEPDLMASPRGSLLKLCHRQVFRTVRTAPIPSIAK